MQSAWFPYIQSLPREIPCVLCCFSYEDIKAIEYEDIRSELDEYVWLVSDAWQRLQVEAHGNSSRDDFDWAMSVIHSRTFGTSGKHGPVDIHLLVPLADMFNHGGDRCKGLLKEPFQELDSVQWTIVPPQKATSGGWEMQFIASAAVPANEQVNSLEVTFCQTEVQVFMSYGERSNDDFFLFYGYIPPFNAKDDHVIFVNLQDAMDWYCHKYLPTVRSTQLGGLLVTDGVQENVEEIQNTALLAAQKEEGPVNRGPDDDMYARGRPQKEKIRVMAGGFVDGRVIATFDTFRNHTGVAVNSAVNERCLELLSGKSPLLGDLQLLAKYCPETEHNFPFLHQFYSTVIEQCKEAGKKMPNCSSTTDLNLGVISFALQLTKTYMVYKKMILWDIILGLSRP